MDFAGNDITDLIFIQKIEQLKIENNKLKNDILNLEFKLFSLEYDMKKKINPFEPITGGCDPILPQ